MVVMQACMGLLLFYQDVRALVLLLVVWLRKNARARPGISAPNYCTLPSMLCCTCFVRLSNAAPALCA
jgi:hypothetical protein